MPRRLMTLVLAACLLLFGNPAMAAPDPGEAYCKGADYTVTVTPQEGKVVSETVHLSWEILYASRNALDRFKNQGQCISFVNHGGVTAASCDLLRNPIVRDSVGCILGLPNFAAWLQS